MEQYMTIALEYAKIAFEQEEVPVGCVIVKDNEIIATGYNQRETNQSALDHAEIIAIKEASKKLNSWRLENCTLYVTLEPCVMCAGAIIQARIKTVVFGAYDPKGGSFGSVVNLAEIKGLNHYPEIVPGVMVEESKQLLQDFFKTRRKINKSLSDSEREA